MSQHVFSTGTGGKGGEREGGGCGAQSDIQHRHAGPTKTPKALNGKEARWRNRRQQLDNLGTAELPINA